MISSAVKDHRHHRREPFEDQSIRMSSSRAKTDQRPIHVKGSCLVVVCILHYIDTEITPIHKASLYGVRWTKSLPSSQGTKSLAIYLASLRQDPLHPLKTRQGAPTVSDLNPNECPTCLLLSKSIDIEDQLQRTADTSRRVSGCCA